MYTELAVYIHIPFCKAKCLYCDFASYSGKQECFAPYFAALKNEIRFFADSDAYKKGNYTVTSIYFGGGTPSYVDEKYIVEILALLKNSFALSSDCEITLEANPDSLNDIKLAAYLNGGVNRISLGVQSINDTLLKRIGRVHDSQSAVAATKLLKNSGIKSFNVDMMFSLPEQTKEQLTESLCFATNCGAEHISAYGLILEENAPLNALYNKGKYSFDEALDADMYELTEAYLNEKGFYRYEISNYARRNAECRHNLNCWDMLPYIGFGAAAHSYFINERFCNTSDLDSYIGFWQNFTSFDASDKKEQRENSVLCREYFIRNAADEMSEFIMLGLRKTTGFSLNAFMERFGVAFTDKYAELVNGFCSQELMKIYSADGKEYACLTKKGLMVSNTVMCEFV